MDVSEITCSSTQMLHIIDELRWQLDWRALDPESIPDGDLRDTLYALWMCVLSHASLMSGVAERMDYVLGGDDVGLAAALDPVLESLEQLRGAFEGLYHNQDVAPVVFAFERFERAVENMTNVEHEVMRGCGSVLFPSQMT